MSNKKMLSAAALSQFSEQLAVLYGSGINLETALAILAENSVGEAAAVAAELGSNIAKGKGLSEAAAESGRFPPYFVRLTEVGEESGRLDETLSSLHVYYDRLQRLNENVKSAVRYPLIMVTVMLVVLTLILTEAMPIFASVYDQIGQSMSGGMIVMLSVGEFIKRNYLIIIAVIAAVVAAVMIINRTPAGARAREWLYENSFLTRKTARYDRTSRVTYALSMCLTSGFDISSALDMTANLVESKKIAAAAAEAKRLIDEDKSVAEALRQSGILPQKYASMVEVGERSGCLERFMRRVCDLCEADADTAADHVISSIEPTVVIVMSVLIGLLLISVMLPLLSIMAGI